MGIKVKDTMSGLKFAKKVDIKYSHHIYTKKITKWSEECVS